MPHLEADINPEMLGWARKRAGFSLEKATKKIGLSLSTLTKMEGGERKPTRRQLDKIAKSYWCPLTVFYASQPPLPTKCGVDFRSSELVTTTTAEEQGRLDALVRDVYARQSIVKDVLEDDEDEEPRSFVGSLKDTGDIDAAVEAVKKILNLPDDKILDFNELRERAHSIGVFVLLVGDLGHHSTRIDASVFRGFAIADPIAPFVIINNYDAEIARSFTLMHELTHVMIGKSGISGEVTIDDSQTELIKIERFCNDVASHILLPAKSLTGINMLDDEATARSTIEKLARKYKVSHSMIAYRLYRENLVVGEIYNHLRQVYKKMWQNQKKQEKQSQRNKGGGGPSFYTLRGNRIGNLLINFVRQSLNANEITYTKAEKILDIKAVSVRTFLEYRRTKNIGFKQNA